MIIHTDSTNFDSIVKEHNVCLVDFFATWCGPCRMLAVEIEDAVAENPNLKVVKVDIDECMDLADKFKIEVVPTMIIFKNGAPVQTITGYLNKDKLLETISPYFS